ncbi:MAG: ATP-binding cassette domain-containing protein [Aestuariivita sp.]|nr:ATP-binding cassette domain-containing protein [Aestuariivita sp.]
MQEAILTLKNVNLSLNSNAGRVVILQKIYLNIKHGESHALVGPSGSGKSSLLMLMAGLEQATSGEILFLNQNLSTMNEDALAKFRLENVGVVFQSFNLIPTMTAIENVATPLELAGSSDAFNRAAEELKIVGLNHRAHHYPNQLSGGEQQRVALARASAPRPTIFFADEPTGNLDATNGALVVDLLFQLRDRYGATLILATHSPDLAAKCDRIVRLFDGRIKNNEEIEMHT